MIFEITGPYDVAGTVASFDLGRPRPVLIVVGGAAGLDEAALGPIFAEVVAPAVRRHEAAAVDGGTASGVMRLLGRARAGGPGFPLIGVAARGTVRFPGNEPTIGDSAELDPNHSHVVLTPGAEWGAESPYLPLVAIALAAGGPVVTLLINGGEVAVDDAVHSVRFGIPVLVLAGTGRTADRIATAASGRAPGGDAPIATTATGARPRSRRRPADRAACGFRARPGRPPRRSRDARRAARREPRRATPVPGAPAGDRAGGQRPENVAPGCLTHPTQ